MTLLQAYRSVLNTGASMWAIQTVRNKRVLAKKGSYPSDKIMRTVVKKAGWKKVCDEQWNP